VAATPLTIGRTPDILDPRRIDRGGKLVKGRLMLLATVLAAIAVTVLTTAILVVVEPTAPRSEAVRTGAISGGTVVALYALWLNDRRRRVEEGRHELEGIKVADERFARSVELLGNEADQVRVGALHSLVWLAGTNPRYKQTVLDILCAYLRRPFDHPAQRDGRSGADAPPDPGADREREVRLTAQRLIADVLPWGDDPGRRNYHLDLSGARLEQFRLEGRRIGRLTARGARFHGSTRLRRLAAAQPGLFADAARRGRPGAIRRRRHPGPAGAARGRARRGRGVPARPFRRRRGPRRGRRRLVPRRHGRGARARAGPDGRRPAGPHRGRGRGLGPGRG